MKNLEEQILDILKEHPLIPCTKISTLIFNTVDETSKIYPLLKVMEEQGKIYKTGYRPALYTLSNNSFIFSSINIAKNIGHAVGGFSSESFLASFENAVSSSDCNTTSVFLERIMHDATYQKNTDQNIVAMKVAQIDIAGSTKLYSNTQFTMQELTTFIVREIPDFDQRVARRDDSLVEQLAHFNGKANLFSFASKYCFYHNSLIYGRDDYAVYDPLVQQTLPFFLAQAGLTMNSEPITAQVLGRICEEKNYVLFNTLVDQVLRHVKAEGKKQHFDLIMRYYRSHVLHD